MFGVELICSDETCAEVAEVNVFSLEELNVLVCDGCGCTLQTLHLWEVTELRPAVRPVAQDLPRAA
jgi:hypothetical protein